MWRRSNERVMKDQNVSLHWQKMKAIKCRQIHPSPAHLISLPEFTLLHSRMEQVSEDGTEKLNFRSAEKKLNLILLKKCLNKAKVLLICPLVMRKFCFRPTTILIYLLFTLMGFQPRIELLLLRLQDSLSVFS